MELENKMRISSFFKYWKKQGRKDMFTWLHRYLRLHSDLLEDSVYQNLYDYIRNELIKYLKKDVDCKKVVDTELGDIVDVLADLFNEGEPERVNKYKPFIDELYKYHKEKTVTQ